jgi:DNA-binding MarR family transcriptional regulator
MTAAPAGADEAPRSVDDVAAVADTFVALMRIFVRTRSKLLAAAQHDVEWSAHVLLRALSTGPMRASALAEAVESDPSTVSRQVAALVRDGFVERRADPEDGRASLLVLTAKADEVLRAQNEIRVEHFNRMLSDWSAHDLRTFAELLGRFTADYDEANTELLLNKIAAGRSASHETTDKDSE